MEIQEFDFVMASSSSPVSDHCSCMNNFAPLFYLCVCCYTELKFLFLMYFLSPFFPGEAGAIEGRPCGLQSCHSPLASPTSLLQT